MEMKKVEEIIQKHNEMLDNMTEEERVAYYAQFGLVIDPSKSEKHIGKIYNKDYVIERLKNGEITLDKYHYAVQHDVDCIKAALSYDKMAYILLDDEMKNNPEVLLAWNELLSKPADHKTIKEEIDFCWDVLYPNIKEVEDTEDEDYACIFPDYVAVQLAVQHAVEEGKDPVKAIAYVVQYLSDEDYSKLKKELQTGSFAKEFINPNMCTGNDLAIQTTIDIQRNKYKRLRACTK